MAFQLKTGREAIDTSAASRGMLQSGATLKDLTQFGQGLASQNYNQAVQQALGNRAQQIGIGTQFLGQGGAATGQAAQMYGLGAQATTNQANLLTQEAQDQASLQQSAGNVEGARNAASGNPLVSGITSGLKAFFSDETMKHDINKVSDSEIDAFLESLQPSTYDYNKEATSQGAPENRQMGVMAQDMEKSPMGKSMVHENEDGKKMVDGEQTVGALIAVAANLNKRIKQLEKK